MRNIPVTLFTFNELYTVSVRFTEIIDPLKADVFIDATLKPLNEKLEILGSLLGKQIDTATTKLLAKKDHIRDKAFVALRDMCKANSNRLDQKLSESGEQLVKIFKNVGYSLHLDGYSVQSSKLMVLFNELQKEHALKALETVGATDWLEDLKSSQVEFEKIYNNKIQSKADEIDYPPRTEVRKDIDRYMEGIISYISLNADTQSEKFGPVAERIEELIAEANRIAKARKTRRKNLSDENVNTEVLTILPEFNEELLNEVEDIK